MKTKPCHGFCDRNVSYGSGEGRVTYSTNVLLPDTKYGQDEGVDTWYAWPDYVVDGSDEIGTFKHFKCLGAVNKESESATCKYCKTIPSLQSFKKRLQNRHEKVKD